MAIYHSVSQLVGNSPLLSVDNYVRQRQLPATILAAARQGLFFIPAVLLMPLWLDQWGVQLAQSVADVLSFALTVVMMRRVFQNLQAEEHAAMLLQHHRASEPYMAENVPENPETT